MASASRGVSLGDGERPLAAFGEVGLTGELRYVAHPERRTAEAAKFGLTPVMCPGDGIKTIKQALRSALAREREPEREAAAA